MLTVDSNAAQQACRRAQQAFLSIALFSVLLTDLLGALHAISLLALTAGWICGGALGIWAWKRFPPAGVACPERAGWFEIVCLAGAAATWLITGLIAVSSPPNSTDAMAYHMPRVLFWAQRGSVSFFATHYPNQIMLQPLAEYLMLQGFVLTGGDRWINLVQFSAMVTSSLAVFAIAGELGGNLRTRLMAAALAVSLPNGILQSTGAKNDYVLAACLACALYFCLAFLRTGAAGEWFWMSAAVSLALFTKGTAYAFVTTAIPVLLAPRGYALAKRWKLLLVTAALVLAVNGALFWRNFAYSGSPLGYDSSHGDGFFRWTNEPPGVRAMTSNAIRHFSDQLGMRSDGWNQRVYGAAIALHRELGLDPADPASTWRWAEFAPPVNSNHEANANNRWHLLLAGFAFLAACARRCWIAVRLFGGLVLAFFVFCFLLKWQPFMSRMWLPLFVAACAPTALLAVRTLPKWAYLAIVLYLLNASRPFLKENWVRPLTGEHSVLRTSRQTQYFADMKNYGVESAYRSAAAETVRKGCQNIGIDASHFAIEYPYEALVREARPQSRFFHVNVKNPSSRYRIPGERPDCVICFDCASDPGKWRQYADFSASMTAGTTMLFGPR